MAEGLFLGPWLFGEDCRIHRKIVLEEAFELPMQEADLSLEAWEVHQDTELQGQGHKTEVVTGPEGQFHPRVPTEVKTPTDPLDPLGVGANLV